MLDSGEEINRPALTDPRGVKEEQLEKSKLKLPPKKVEETQSVGMLEDDRES